MAASMGQTPANTASPGPAERTKPSPVRRASCRQARPATTVPSTGMISPGRTRTRLPASISPVRRRLAAPSGSITSYSLSMRPRVNAPSAACWERATSRRPSAYTTMRIDATSKYTAPRPVTTANTDCPSAPPIPNRNRASTVTRRARSSRQAFAASG
jgi:hypothetical protein